jgi:hypothetical protein
MQGYIARDPLMHVASGAEALARGLVKKLSLEPPHGFAFYLIIKNTGLTGHYSFL